MYYRRGLFRFEVEAASGIFSNFLICMLDYEFLDSSVSHFFAPHFGMSALCVKCTKLMG